MYLILDVIVKKVKCGSKISENDVLVWTADVQEDDGQLSDDVVTVIMLSMEWSRTYL